MWIRCCMHRKPIRICTIFLNALLIMTLLMGCGNPQSAPLQTGGKAGGTGAPISGGSVNIVMPANPNSLSPLEANSREMVDLFSLIYDTLVRLDASMRPVPGLAERWEHSEDGKTWTFYLSKTATFHNGQPLVAADVVYTLDQLQAIYTSTDRTSLYSGVIGLISSYSATDDHTVVINTKESSAKILHWLDFPVLEKDSLSSGSIVPGTGPYRVESYQAGKQLILKSNDKWWRRAPYITTIVAKSMPDPETALTSMDVKLVDIVHSISLTAHSYKRQDVTNTYELMTQELECIIPNMNNSKLSDQRMRQAIIAALDRKTIMTEKYLNHAVSIEVPITSDSYLYESTHTQHTYSPSRAKELLAALGYADTNGDGIVEKGGEPLHFDIIVNENTLNTARVDAAKMAKDQLKAVGISCDVTSLSFSNFQTKLTGGTFDLAFAAFSIPTDGDLRFMLSSGGSKNYSHYSDSTLDGLLNNYVKALTESEQVTTIAEVQKYIAEKLPIIPLYFRTNTLVCSASVMGVTGARDMNVYRSIEQWFMFREGDEDKAAKPSAT